MRLSFFAERRLACASLAGVLTCALFAIPATAQTPAAEQVRVHATYDAAYLYFAFQIDDTDVTGTNTRPLSHPEQDDSVGVFFESGSARPGAPDANTHAMIVSAAEGFTLLDGDPATKTLIVPARPNFSIKYGVRVQGTLNRSDDRDAGYTVTMAVPLSLVGLTPESVKPGLTLGFNAIVRSRAAKAFTSLAPAVATEAEIADPSKWTQLTLVGPAGKPAAQGVTSPQVDPKGAPPIIDGVYRAVDWPDASRVAFASPDKPNAAPVVVAAPKTDFSADARMPALDLTKPIPDMQRRIFARYLPGYQADLRRLGVPTRGVFRPDGTLILADQPATGVGPWFSSDRVRYQQGEMIEMRRAGIDVALVQIGGPDGPDASADEKALLVLVAALREMATTGTPAPQLALLLDTGRLTPDGAKLDLAQARGRDSVYAAIRRFMRLVPPEFRARVSPPSGGSVAPAYPVFFSDGNDVSGVEDPTWTNSVRERFAADFGPQTGATTLLFAGRGAGWEGASNVFATIAPAASGPGTGAVSSFVVQPGRVLGGIVGRHAGQTYRDTWNAAIARGASWILIDSWNDFTAGSEIAASRQYGPQYTDLTRIYAIQASGLKDQDVRWLGNDAPRRMYPGQVVTTTVTFQNVGMSILRGDKGVGLTYRWLQNGKTVAEAPVRLTLGKPILPTITTALPVGLAAASVNADNRFTPLPPGDYVVEIDLTRTLPAGVRQNFSEHGGSPAMRIPITIAADLPDYVQFDSTITPTILRGGEIVPTAVRLRWMGGSALGIGEASLIYQIRPESGGGTATTGTLPLPRALPPGQWVTIPTTLRTSEATVPLAPATPELRAGGGPGGYTVRWLLTRTNSVEAIPGEYLESIAVYPAAESAQVMTPVARPGVFEAAMQAPVSVRVVNNGATAWPKGAYAVGCHWYDADGLEADWKPIQTTILDKAVQPGDAIVVPASVRAPDHEGDYVLALDVVRTADGVFLSTLPGSRASGVGLMPIRVRGHGRLTFVDLTPAFNCDAVAPDTRADDGDADGAKHTFPAESFPPDRFGIVGLLSPATEDRKGKPEDDRTAYPSGYYADAVSTDRQIAFRYGSSSNGAKNAVAGGGPTVPVQPGQYIGLHVAAASTDGMAHPLSLTLNYRTGAPQTVTASVADWMHAAGPTDSVALTAAVRRGAESDASGPCSIWHVIVSTDATRELVSVTFPAEPAVKVFAATLEK
jgi:hypothetical protein